MDPVLTATRNVQTGARSCKTNQMLFAHKSSTLKSHRSGVFLFNIYISGTWFLKIGCLHMILVSTTFQGSDHIVDQFSTVVAARIDCSPPINLQHHNLFTAIHSAAMHQIDHNLVDIRSQRTHNSEPTRQRENQRIKKPQKSLDFPRLRVGPGWLGRYWPSNSKSGNVPACR